MLTTLDIIVLLLLGGGAVLGAMRGFVCEVLSLFAWVAAVMALNFLHGRATALLTGVIHNPTGAAVLAFVLVFGVTFFAGRMAARALGRRTRNSVLGPIDRLLGAGFGALKGLLIATVGFLAVVLVCGLIWGKAAERPAWMREARTYPLLNASGRAVVDFVHARRGDAAPADGRRNTAGDGANPRP